MSKRFILILIPVALLIGLHINYFVSECPNLDWDSFEKNYFQLSKSIDNMRIIVAEFYHQHTHGINYMIQLLLWCVTGILYWWHMDFYKHHHSHRKYLKHNKRSIRISSYIILAVGMALFGYILAAYTALHRIFNLVFFEDEDDIAA